MTTLRAHANIDAPAIAVWDLLAHEFDRIGDWATVVPKSHLLPGEPRVAGAPVAGRVCATAFGTIPEVTERITAYDEAGRTLAYEAVGLPPFVGTASNRWSVTALDGRRCRVDLEATLQVRGVLGWVLYPAIRMQIFRAGPRFLADLKHFAETGHPSTRKLRQLLQRAPAPRRP